MAYPEMLIEREAYMADTELENMRLRDDLEEMKKGGSYWWRKWEKAVESAQTWMNQWRNAEDRVIPLERKLKTCQKELKELESLWRDHLDECDPQDDNEWESQARQILCTASDIEKQIAVEGYIPF